jgi:hypothetical protein
MSLAQQLSEEQIRQGNKECRDNNITLKWFPHKMSWSVRRHAKMDRKNELADAIALWKWCFDSPDCWHTSKNPIDNFEPSDKTRIGWIHKEILNEIFNELRATIRYELNPDGSIKRNKQGQPTKIPWYKNDELPGWNFVTKHMYRIREELDPKYWECFGFDVVYGCAKTVEGHRFEKGDWNPRQLKRLIPTLMYHVLVDLDGNLIYKPQIAENGDVIGLPKEGHLPGRDYMQQHIFMHKPYHE